MMLPLALQIVLPVVMVGWLAFTRPRSLIGLTFQVAATAIVLVAISLVGLWTFLPGWTPYALGILLLAATANAVRRKRQALAASLPSITGWCSGAFFLALGGAALFATAAALLGGVPPKAAVTDLTFPLAHGTYLIVNGGNHSLINAHLKTLDTTVPRYRAWRGQSYGVDIVSVNGFGLRAPGLRPSQPSDYFIYDVSVLAPCSGEIIHALDGLSDNRVPETDREHMAGNHLILRCGDVDVVLGHLRPGSLIVAIGDLVRAGDAIAAVGNSGNSDEPHLHVHAQRTATSDLPLSGDPQPIRFDGRFLVRNDRVSAP
jgi:hypothetical protein